MVMPAHAIGRALRPLGDVNIPERRQTAAAAHPLHPVHHVADVPLCLLVTPWLTPRRILTGQHDVPRAEVRIDQPLQPVRPVLRIQPLLRPGVRLLLRLGAGLPRVRRVPHRVAIHIDHRPRLNRPRPLMEHTAVPAAGQLPLHRRIEQHHAVPRACVHAAASFVNRFR